MREIKFRGYSHFIGGFIYGGISIFENEATIYDMNDLTNSAYDVDINTVGQFTGLKDKNGVDIYEGDIVLSKYTVQNYTQEDIGFNPRFHNVPMYKEVSIKGIVVYDPAIFRLADKNGIFIGDGYPDWDLLEVIGNIHQNPELL